MQVEVPLGNGDATQRRIERIAAPGAGLEREAMRMRVTLPVVGMPVMAVSIMDMAVVVVPVVVVPMVMITGGSVHFAPGAQCNPETEGDECGAGDEIDLVPITLRGGDADQPDGDAERQRRRHVSDAGLKGYPRRLGARPATLSCQQGDGCPMIRHHGVEYTDDDDAGYEGEFGSEWH